LRIITCLTCLQSANVPAERQPDDAEGNEDIEYLDGNDVAINDGDDDTPVPDQEEDGDADIDTDELEEEVNKKKRRVVKSAHRDTVKAYRGVGSKFEEGNGT
jgi:hypothetical protein